jgi:hypothetical protein
LKDYAASRDSYIEEFWVRAFFVSKRSSKGIAQDESYLNYDEPVVLSLNPFFILQSVAPA